MRKLLKWYGIYQSCRAECVTLTDSGDDHTAASQLSPAIVLQYTILLVWKCSLEQKKTCPWVAEEGWTRRACLLFQLWNSASTCHLRTVCYQRPEPGRKLGTSTNTFLLWVLSCSQRVHHKHGSVQWNAAQVFISHVYFEHCSTLLVDVTAYSSEVQKFSGTEQNNHDHLLLIM